MTIVPLEQHTLLCMIEEATQSPCKDHEDGRRQNNNDFSDGYDGVLDASKFYMRNKPKISAVYFVAWKVSTVFTRCVVALEFPTDFRWCTFDL